MRSCVKRFNKFNNLKLAALDYTRKKDPPVSLATASIYSSLVQQNLKCDYLVQSVSSDIYSYNCQEMIDFAMEDANKDTDFAIGAYIWNDFQVKEILLGLKNAKFPGRIILGGPQISYASAGTLEKYYKSADIFIRGYAENALCSVLKHESNINGVHYYGKDDKGTVAQLNFEHLASPILSNTLKPQNFIRWEAQRGCPFKCSFCQHREASLIKHKHFNVCRSKKEIEWICHHKDIIRNIAVVDPTFNSGPNYIHILNEFANNGFDGNISLQCRLEMVTLEFLNAVNNINNGGGNITLEFGLQTIHPIEQMAINRPNNLKKACRILQQVMKFNIEHEISLIFGLPNQTVTTFSQSIEWCQRNAPKAKIIAFPLMLLRGTSLYHQKERYNMIEEFTPAHPLLSYYRVQENIPHVISSATFTKSEWYDMADMANSLLR